MKRFKNVFFILILISLITSLASCGAMVKGTANKKLTVEKGAIPPEFGSEKTTMLFITHHRSYNKYLKKNVADIYKGDFEIISEKEFKSDVKYEDKQKYRYVFNFESKSYSYTKSDLSSGSGEVKKFYVLDRKNEKKYFSPMTSSFWSKLQKVYLKKLTEKLKV
ncbi:hypothetical protein [Aequorivita sp. Q41]|uniref:hypothetical protein n=1 Tax=Aequorivita sp. Q41 TaxID=3153300 RepID=UPI0032421961